MTTPPPPPVADWPRPYWKASGEDALLLFFVFGTFAPDLRIPAAKYASLGLPEGVELFRYPQDALRRWEGYPLKGALGEVLRGDDAEAFAAAHDAPEALAVRGRVADPSSLDYLRDTLGVVAGLLDLGGAVVVDPQILSLFDADAWRRRYLVESGAPPRNHVLVLNSTDADDPQRQWVRTRGMRKFGRPDLSVRGVPPAEASRAGALCEQLVELQALGSQFVHGQVLQVDGVPGGLKVSRGGSMDDPLFNNTHVELRWPR